MNIKQITLSAIEYLQKGDLQYAESLFRHILKIQPNNVSALHFLGVIYYQRKDYNGSIEHINKALHFGPNYADAYNNLGIVLQETGHLEEATVCYKKALNLNPNFSRAYYNLGNIFREKWQLNNAIHNYQKAIQLEPNFFEAYNNIALALQDQGLLKEAEKNYRNALQIKPDFPECYSNLLLMMHYDTRYDSKKIFYEHLRYANQLTRSFSPSVMPYNNDCSSVRRLKIGYVSPDFRRHSVAYFIEPIITTHERQSFEVICYSDVPREKEDEVTLRIQGHSDQWRNITAMSDEQVAQQIQSDQIDILIDLAGHTAFNRMPVFARKPAPIQVSWIGYPATTGLSTMDFKIVDSYTDPQGMTEKFFTEKLLRMPDSFLCYLPDKDSPEIKPLPALSSGHITFGSFNYSSKISPDTVTLWANILNRMPSTCLLLKSRNFVDSKTGQHIMNMFNKLDISAERIVLIPSSCSFIEHLSMYNQIDIALDTYPYNGTTTICEALWMGVPVITLSGNTHVSRVGMSILSNAGLSNFIAESHEQYQEIAINTAHDFEELQRLRTILRDKLLNSALLQKERFTRNLEHIYRDIWNTWCQSHKGGDIF
ncbi:MAG: tetratricopeptide repeat protein [Nitrospirota bacterium]